MDVVEAVERGGTHQSGLVTHAQLRAAGISARSLSHAVGSGRVLRVARAVYGLEPLPAWPRIVVLDGVPDRAFVRRVRAVLLQLTAGAGASGLTAAAVRGWGLLVEPRGPIEVEVPRSSRGASPPGSVVHRRRQLEVTSVRVAPGERLACVPAVRVVHGCLGLPLLQLVVVLDSGLRAGDLTVAEVASSVTDLPLSRDRARLLRALQLCDPESGSVLETVFRVRLQLAGITGWETQRVVKDRRGRYVVRTDVCFDGARLVVELDGSRWHADRQRDRLIDNALAACGWRVLRYGWDEVVGRPGHVLREVRDALLPPLAEPDSVVAC